jgi:hypothetical protein
MPTERSTLNQLRLSSFTWDAGSSFTGNAGPEEVSRQWQLLHLLADHHGMLTWKSLDACRKNQKRKELLARDLKAFFRIEGEPIMLTEDSKGWQTRFHLQPNTSTTDPLKST